MADIFISYSSEDRERVRPLAEALEKRGLTVWWDRALAAGDDYATVIQRALDEARAVIVVWSRNSVDSPWVRDEAARARDAKRLVPIMLDQAPIPMGFGSINAEDFSAWNGGANAPQVDVLYEALKARLEGRAPDVASRRRAKARIQLVSVLTVVALAIVSVAGALYIWDARNKPAQVVSAAPAPQSELARLLELVSQGKITGDQAVELSKLLQQQAFADIATPPSSAPDAFSSAPGDAQFASVSASELDQSAKATFSDAAAQLLQDPNPAIRTAALEASTPSTRQSGMDKLWTIAKEGGPSAGTIYRYCAAIGILTEDTRTQVALERARDSNPQDRRLWRLLSAEYSRKDDPKAAQGAALVGEGLSEAAQGQADQAATTLEKALPLLPSANSRAFVLGQLGDAAAKRDDWGTAEKRYRAAVDLHAQTKDVAGVAIDAPKLARAQMQQGERRKACATLNTAKRLGVDTVAGQLAQNCEDGKAAPSATP